MGGRRINFYLIGIWVTLLLLIPLASSVYADIYRYIDENGVMHFTNTPTSNAHEYKLYLKEKTTLSRKFYATDKYDRFISDASAQTGVDSRLIKAMIKAESDFNPRAVSKKGAITGCTGTYAFVLEQLLGLQAEPARCCAGTN